MTNPTRHGLRPLRRPLAAPGFTLVELLLVMFVMGVLVALVVGVGSYVIESGRKTETIQKQQLLISAIRAYYKITQTYPIDRDPNYPNDPNRSIDGLIWCLAGNMVQAATAEERDRIKREISQATAPFLSAINGDPKLDAFDKPMRFYRYPGLGGKPLILSGGPDEDFGDRNADKRQDNIRSDTRE